MVLTTAKWVLEDYHKMIDAGILDDRHVELLNGEIIEMSPEGEPHACYSGETADYLRSLLGSRVKVREGKPITLPNNSEPEPDIAIVLPPGGRYLDHHPYPEDIFWLIEFSNSSLDKDLETKNKIYAEVGIQEYWVVNLKEMKLIVFRQPSKNGYQSAVTLTSGSITPLAFPDVQVDVRQVLTV